MQSTRAFRSEAVEPIAAPLRAAKAVIGPNAAIQLAAALRRADLDDFGREIFANAGASDWWRRPPDEMVDEVRVARLHQSVRARLAAERARGILQDAGNRTADYLLAHRIPKPFKRLLSLLPRGLAQRAFLVAIQRHAWTFVGSGRFVWRTGAETVLEVRGNPFCANERRTSMACAWHAAVFQRLFSRLVSPEARVEETACEACGDDACRFALRWEPKATPRDPERLAE